MTMFWVKQEQEQDTHHEAPNGPLKNADDNDNDKHKEDVIALQNTLEDLKEERRRNQELQAKIDALKLQQKQKEQKEKEHHHKKRQSTHTSFSPPPSAIPGKELVSLQAQVEGYRQLVDVLTAGRPAVEAAVQALQHPKLKYRSHTCSTSTPLAEANLLPLHVVRFLELMPWHATAQEAAAVTEELYEWQVYHPVSKVWRAKLVFFPAFFKALPVIQPAVVDGEAKPGVWTNRTLTQRFDLRKGYHNNNSPDEPSWKWIGKWQVDTTSQQQLDQEGWAYAKEAGHFLDTGSSCLIAPETVLANQAQQQDRDSSRMVRRRKWSRRRVLVDYPYASEPTVQYLKLRAHQEELLLTNQALKTHLQQETLQREQQEALHKTKHQQWDQKRTQLESRLRELEEEAKHYQELLDRQKGPPVNHFSFPHTKQERTWKDLIEDDDDSTVSDCSVTSAITSSIVAHEPQHQEEEEEEEEDISTVLRNLDQMLLLQPEDDAVDRREESKADHDKHREAEAQHLGLVEQTLQVARNFRSSHNILGASNGWGHHEPAGTTKATITLKDLVEAPEEPVPEVEACSDDNSSDSSEDETERTIDDILREADEEDDDVDDVKHIHTLYSCLPPQFSSSSSLLATETAANEEHHQSFLQKLFNH